MQLKSGADEKTAEGRSALFDAVYANREQLEVIFRFFDTDGDSVISREEFRRGCAAINASAAVGETLDDPDRMLELIDRDGDGFIGPWHARITCVDSDCSCFIL